MRSYHTTQGTVSNLPGQDMIDNNTRKRMYVYIQNAFIDLFNINFTIILLFFFHMVSRFTKCFNVGFCYCYSEHFFFLFFFLSGAAEMPPIPSCYSENSRTFLFKYGSEKLFFQDSDTRCVGFLIPSNYLTLQILTVCPPN